MQTNMDSSAIGGVGNEQPEEEVLPGCRSHSTMARDNRTRSLQNHQEERDRQTRKPLQPIRDHQSEDNMTSELTKLSTDSVTLALADKTISAKSAPC